MTLKRSDVRKQLDDSLIDCGSVWGEEGANERSAAMDRFIDAALTDLNRVTPNVCAGSLSVTAGSSLHPAPDDALRFIDSEWVERNALRQPWTPQYVAVVPQPRLVRLGNVKSWQFSPPLDATTLAKLGSAFHYTYIARHRLTEDEAQATFDAALIPLVILRAQVEAMKEMAMRNSNKPMQTRDALYSQTRNGTPAALAEMLMKLFEAQTRNTAEPYGLYR